MVVDFLLQVWSDNHDREAIIWRDKTYTYGWLGKRFREWKQTLKTERIPRGSVTVLEGDFSPNAVALFFALLDHSCILVPLTATLKAKKDEFISIAQGEFSFAIDDLDSVSINSLPHSAAHPLYNQLRTAGHPGLVLFSSGSTGESKAAVHDMVRLLDKFRQRRQSLRTITFLLYDHIGGVNTMLHTLSNGGCVITVLERHPDAVLEAVEKYKAELLPTSPTFLNLVLMTEAYKRHELSSLKTISYGTEPMPEFTLRRIHELFPNVNLQQTYGLSELGILRSKSKEASSLWVKIGGEGFETRIVDGTLQIKASSAMLGYLNAPSPFTEDGWFNTGDAVEVDGDYVKFLGRKSEVINIGGEKVYPAEVESVIEELASVAQAVVYGEKNSIMGNIVCANVTPSSAAAHLDHKEVTRTIKQHCRERLQKYKVPVKVKIATESQHTERFKKNRR
jgi:acyl-CoA synthetase (AMP-forming)/AMP-acid ligase II